MLFIMSKSGKDLFSQASQLCSRQSRSEKSAVGVGNIPSSKNSVDSSRLTLVLQSMVVSQVILVVMTFTSYHVQIITRLSSGYPAWYWWVAACLSSPKTRKMGGGIVVFMVMYASIQAVLYASFLPPA